VALKLVHGLVFTDFYRLTVSLPSSCGKVDAGRWGRSQAYEGLLRSVREDAVAALIRVVGSAVRQTRSWRPAGR
jgi:hypothetical protein